MAELGLSPGPYRPSKDPAARPETHGPVHALAHAATELGPAFALFARYLATRPDLLPIEQCLRLEKIRGGAETEDLVPWIRNEIGENHLAHVEPSPVAVGVLHHTFRARLFDGRRVLVRAIGPRTVRRFEEDEEHLELLRPGLEGVIGSRQTFSDLLGDFRRDAAARMSGSAQARGIEAFRRDLVDPEGLGLPEIFPHLSTEHCLVAEDLDGLPFHRLAAEGIGVAEAYDAQRRLSLAFLQQALTGGTFPIDGEPIWLRDGRAGLRWGIFAHIPAADQPNLWEYLRHTAAHRPDEACRGLLRELIRRNHKMVDAEEELHLRLRQIVPFRDGCWSRRGDTLAEHLVLHWRTAREIGFLPRGPLQSLYRGLFWVARAQDLEGDPLGEGLQDLRLIAEWEQLRRLLQPGRVGRSMEETMAGLLEMPHKIDRLLDLAGDERGLRIQVAASPTLRRRGSAVGTVTILLAMVALPVLSAELARLGLAEVLLERLGAVIFCFFGLLWLRSVWRS